MSINPGRRFLDQKSHVLLSRSEIIKDYPEVFALLDTKDRITYGDIELVSADVDRFLKYDLDNVLTAASGEWQRTSEPPEDRGLDKDLWARCMLCGTPNRYIYFIRNRRNGNELNVGSECIEHFGIDPRTAKEDALLRRKARETKLKSDLNKLHPGAVRIIESLDADLDEFPLLIPDKLAQKYREFVADFGAVYRRYLEGKTEPQTVVDWLPYREQRLAEVEQYVQDNKDLPLVVTRELCATLMRSGKVSVVRSLGSGFIDGRNVHELDVPDVMQQVAPMLDGFLRPNKMSVVRVDEKARAYVVSVQGIALDWYCPHTQLLTVYGRMVFGEVSARPVSLPQLIKLSSIRDERSISTLLDMVNKAARQSAVRIVTHDSEYGEVLLQLGGEDKYTLVKLPSFLNEFKDVAVSAAGVGNRLEAFAQRYGDKPLSSEDIVDIAPRYRGAVKVVKTVKKAVPGSP